MTKKLFDNEHRILGLMLFCLLLAILISDDTNISRSFLIIHFGLFLLWQPVVKQEVSFSAINLIFLIGFILCFILWFNLWIATFWMLLLMSLLTGRIFARGLGRAVYGLAVIVLFIQLTLIITPALFAISGLHASYQTTASIFLLLLSLLPVFAPATTQHSTHVDFIRGFLVIVLTLFLAMGSILTSFTLKQSYLQSLAGTIIVAALFLLALAVLWVPRAGFAGLAQLWEKYLLNIGGPFEQWLGKLSVLETNTNIAPEEFLEASIRYLLDRHWIAGIFWKTGYAENLEGNRSHYIAEYNDKKIQLRLYAHSPVGPALMLHTKLLLSVISFYYSAKLQEQQLIKQAHLRAIYETGSKLTHDIKNILQSAQTLAEIVSEDASQTDDARALLRTQLPLLAQRLKSTLEKLNAPRLYTSDNVKAETWWQQLMDRYTGRDIIFNSDIKMPCNLPAEIFDSIAENLLENAREKRISEPETIITISLDIDVGKLHPTITLRVHDTGRALPPAQTKLLFRELLQSENGLGIGLYQSYQQAQRIGYTLALTSNQPGNVCFMLSNDI